MPFKQSWTTISILLSIIDELMKIIIYDTKVQKGETIKSDGSQEIHTSIEKCKWAHVTCT